MDAKNLKQLLPPFLAMDDQLERFVQTLKHDSLDNSLGDEALLLQYNLGKTMFEFILLYFNNNEKAADAYMGRIRRDRDYRKRMLNV